SPWVTYPLLSYLTWSIGRKIPIVNWPILVVEWGVKKGYEKVKAARGGAIDYLRGPEARAARQMKTVIDRFVSASKNTGAALEDSLNGKVPEGTLPDALEAAKRRNFRVAGEKVKAFVDASVAYGVLTDAGAKTKFDNFCERCAKIANGKEMVDGREVIVPV